MSDKPSDQFTSGVLDPRNVERICALEPWCVEVTRQGVNSILFGSVPQQFRDMANKMPEGSPEHSLYAQAAEKAEQLYQKQILTELDPEKVAEYCEAEPVFDKPLETILGGQIGYVSDKLEAAARMFPEGSAENSAYSEAFDQAKTLYHEQLKAIANAYVRGKGWAALEETGRELWKRSHGFKENGTYLSSRLFWLADAIGHIYMMSQKNNPGGPDVPRR